jgi:N-acetylmuramoyl-L-alanine amidase
MKKAFIIGHHEKSKGAFSPFLKTTEWDFYKSIEYYLEQIGDVYIHNPDINSYTKRCKDIGRRIGSDYDLVISLHFNSFNGSANGCEVLYNKPNQISALIASKFCHLVNERMGIKNRGAKGITGGRGYGELIHVQPNAILIEPFFGDNQSDCVAIIKSELVEILNEL